MIKQRYTKIQDKWPIDPHTHILLWTSYSPYANEIYLTSFWNSDHIYTMFTHSCCSHQVPLCLHETPLKTEKYDAAQRHTFESSAINQGDTVPINNVWRVIFLHDASWNIMSRLHDSPTLYNGTKGYSFYRFPLRGQWNYDYLSAKNLGRKKISGKVCTKEKSILVSQMCMKRNVKSH